MLEEVIASDTELRLLALAELDQFRRDYQVCRRRFRHDKTVVFPAAPTVRLETLERRERRGGTTAWTSH